MLIGNGIVKQFSIARLKAGLLPVFLSRTPSISCWATLGRAAGEAALVPKRLPVVPQVLCFQWRFSSGCGSKWERRYFHQPAKPTSSLKLAPDSLLNRVTRSCLASERAEDSRRFFWASDCSRLGWAHVNKARFRPVLTPIGVQELCRPEGCRME